MSLVHTIRYYRNHPFKTTEVEQVNIREFYSFLKLIIQILFIITS